eukprot:CAMPEP_0173430494 /NCGR_PEP_ID=MMETSP1357-20121228/8898_1 /TAXON_ID=77926 /ORGANISM="Hemiselmis rufescens, Strain PCC563" /LENGTH=123 /DNA_ID=CAMNT_0014394829 /DNA_START=67 /DNA_END=438 /DNA_ORIENTATION=+
MQKTLFLFALLAFAALAQAQDTRKENPWRDFVFEDKFQYVNLCGGLALAGYTVLMVIVVVLRDVLKVWSCFGMTETATKPIPQRALTAMSAAYMGAQPNAPVREQTGFPGTYVTNQPQMHQYA